MPVLPFLKKKTQVGVAVDHRFAEAVSPGLLEASAELMRAVEAKDARSVALALESAFYLLDSMPHEEGPNEEDEEGDE